VGDEGMISEIEYRGQWWLPEYPERSIYGALTFSQEKGAVLSLEGSFTHDPNIGELFNPPIVNGISSTGIRITLSRCLGKGLTISSGGNSTSKLYAHNVFAGAHFKNEDDISFNVVEADFSHLYNWLGISGFKHRHKGEEIHIRFKRPESINALINSQIALTMGFGYAYNPMNLREVDLKQSTGIRLLPVEKMNYYDFREVIRQFQDFLSLATMEYVYPTSIIGISDSEDKKIVEGEDVYIPRIKILYQLARSLGHQ